MSIMPSQYAGDFHGVDGVTHVVAYKETTSDSIVSLLNVDVDVTKSSK